MLNDTFVKNDGGVRIGSNIRKLRMAKNMKTSDLVREVNLPGVSMTIFSLSKIEANTQHVRASQLKAIKEVLQCSYEDLLKNPVHKFIF